MKKFYKAMATITDGTRKWNICIYSGYKTIEEANNGINKFSEKYNVVESWVE